jgi:hypothetical protein
MGAYGSKRAVLRTLMMMMILSCLFIQCSSYGAACLVKPTSKCVPFYRSREVYQSRLGLEAGILLDSVCDMSVCCRLTERE